MISKDIRPETVEALDQMCKAAAKPTIRSLVATLQVINTTPGLNERAVITLQYATFEVNAPRKTIEWALRHVADQMVILMDMKHVARLPVQWQVNEVDQ